MRWATLICDASFHPKAGIGAWAAWIRIDGATDPIAKCGVLTVDVTNSTFAEIYAALNGIWLARHHGAQAVLVRSDCMTVVDLVEGRIRPNSKVSRVWQSALARPDMKGVLLKAQHVKGHGDIVCRATWVNDWADRHAKQAMRDALNQRNRRKYGNQRNKQDRPRGQGERCPAPTTGAPGS